MGIMATKLSAYLANATDEQIEEIRRTIEEFSLIGPFVEDFLNSYPIIQFDSIDFNPEFNSGFLVYRL